MLHLDITGVRGKTITPAMGIPDQDFSAQRTTLRRYVDDWLKERTKGMHRWSMDPNEKKVIDAVRDAAMRAKADGIQSVVWIGIGGSGLGPRVMQEVFEGTTTPEFIVLDTLDPSALQTYLQMIPWKSTLVVVTSKSGDTLEPMSLFFLCYEELQKVLRKKAASHVIAITDPEKGSLRTFCLQERIAMLPIHPDVGGRYSIFSPVGLLPIALLGGDVAGFVRGAKAMDTLCQRGSLDENPAALLAATQFLLDTMRDYPLRVIMPYGQRLQNMARWEQQLLAESLGKVETRNPIPVAAMGTQDQHSLLQQWMAGPRNYWHLFLRVVEQPHLSVPRDLPPEWRFIAGKSFGSLLDACYEGTSQALTSVKRPHATITLSRLDAYHLGQLFFLLMAEVVLLGKLYRIDPYGQPAVEIGKKITREILSR